MTGEVYKTFEIAGTTVECIDHNEGFGLQIAGKQYDVYADSEGTQIDLVSGEDREYLGRASKKWTGNEFEAAKFILAENIENAIRELPTADIVSTAYHAMIPGKADGHAVFDPKTGLLEPLTLQKGNWIPDDYRIYIYTVDQNELGNSSYSTCGDILSEEEYADMQTKGITDPAEYLEKYTTDTFEDRYVQYLIWCFDNGDELKWERIREQINDYLK